MIKTKNGLPTLCATTCEEMLRDWAKGKRKSLPFGVPMVWREPKEHLTDCYFCLVNTKDIGKKNWRNFSYPSIPSAIRPVLHSNEFPSPVFNGFLSSEDEETGSEEERMDMEYKKQMRNLKTCLLKAKKQFPSNSTSQNRMTWYVIWTYLNKQLRY